MSPGSSHARHLAEAGRLANEIRLSVEQVSYAYSANPAQAPLFTLEATSFQARPGEIVAILGPNASGKSTLLKLIAGALAPLSGRILLNGFVTHSLTPRTRAQRIAVVQQESGLLDALRRLAAANRYTVVVVTHELNLAAEYADQVVLMQRGRCLRVGPPINIYQRELLEQVFQTPLTVELGSSGRPRVTVLAGT